MTNPLSPPSAQDLLARAGAALNRRDARAAAELADACLMLDPDDGEALYVAGLAAIDLRRWSKALELLQRAAGLRPGHAAYTVHLARALAGAQRNGEALQVANIAAALAPQDPLLLDTLGNVYMACHAPERAAAALRRGAALAPTNAVCRFNSAMALVFSGDVDGAENEFEACLALAPDYWRAHGALSRIRRQTPTSNHIPRLLSLLPRADGQPLALMQLHVALAKEYEDLADYATAFMHLAEGKAAIRRKEGYSWQQDVRNVDALMSAFATTPAVSSGCLTDEPIFVIGMPRSGTTLVERILSSHPEVHSAGELEDFPVVLERLTGLSMPMLPEPAGIERVQQIDWLKLGQRYLASTRPTTSLKPRFIDKLPHNFLYLGFIAQALPRATIICLRRNPLDTCLSNFREPFSPGSPRHGYAFDLLDTGRYFIQFERLMTHWKRIFPGRILEIDYETLVSHQQASTRQLLAHCALPWNPACLHFERNQASSTTASSVQVRAAIHPASVRRWKHYEHELTDLRQLLTAAGIDCGD